MRIVFIGATGQVVESARSLLENGHEVVIVDAGQERLRPLEEMGLDCGLVHGDGSRPDVVRARPRQHGLPVLHDRE